MPEPAPWNPDGHAAAARPPLATIRALEAVAARCWPPLESEQHGGWVLRAAEGLTRRANSLWPRADPKTPVPQAIAHVEAWYAARGLLPRVTLSPTQQPPDLAAWLRAMGWTDADAPTDVLRRPLPWQGARHDGRATITSVPTEDWFAVAGDASPGQFGGPPGRTARRILAQITASAGYVVVRDDRRDIACGRAVLTDGHVGVFSMATRSEARRQGHAGRVLAALIAWGTNLGAHTAWLQVEQSNLGARRLYDRAGFTVVYSYAYSAAPA